MSDEVIFNVYEQGGYRPTLTAKALSVATEQPLPPLLVDKLEFGSITAIPPRPWAYGHFLLLGCASALGAVDGGGKGSIAVMIALETVTGKSLLGERIWRKGPVAIISYEDDKEEWQRRIAAACLHHEIDYTQVITGIHFFTRPGDRVSFGRLIDASTVAFPDSAEIIAEIKRIGAALLIVDPFNHAHDLADGNNNVMVAKVAWEMSQIARECRISVLVLHHLRKGADGSPDDLMGATSLRATFRSCRILQRMPPDLAKKMNIAEPWRYIRIAGSKENYAPPPERATWFKLTSVPLGNATNEYPAGDDVAVATMWQPRPIFEGLSAATLAAVFSEIRQTVYGPTKQARHTPWVGKALMDIGGRSKREADSIVAEWLKSGVLIEGSYYHSGSRHEVKKVTLDDVKVAQILAEVGTFNASVE